MSGQLLKRAFFNKSNVNKHMQVKKGETKMLNTTSHIAAPPHTLDLPDTVDLQCYFFLFILFF